MPRILIIEDDRQLRLALKENLSISGFIVDDACNGLDGLAKQDEHPADLIIMDILMPEKEGIETIKEVKRDFPSTKIIAISGGATLGPDHYLKTALAFGADRALKKPFRTKSLLKAIEDLLS